MGAAHLTKFWEHCIGNHNVVTSQFMLDELREKLTGKFKYTSESADVAIELLKSRMEVVTTAPLASPVCRDADDDIVLATALAGRCELIITGDKDLLVLQRMNNIKIVNPATFAQTEGIE